MFDEKVVSKKDALHYLPFGWEPARQYRTTMTPNKILLKRHIAYGQNPKLRAMESEYFKRLKTHYRERKGGFVLALIFAILFFFMFVLTAYYGVSGAIAATENKQQYYVGYQVAEDSYNDYAGVQTVDKIMEMMASVLCGSDVGIYAGDGESAIAKTPSVGGLYSLRNQTLIDPEFNAPYQFSKDSKADYTFYNKKGDVVVQAKKSGEYYYEYDADYKESTIEADTTNPDYSVYTGKRTYLYKHGIADKISALCGEEVGAYVNAYTLYAVVFFIVSMICVVFVGKYGVIPGKNRQNEAAKRELLRRAKTLVYNLRTQVPELMNKYDLKRNMLKGIVSDAITDLAGSLLGSTVSKENNDDLVDAQALQTASVANAKGGKTGKRSKKVSNAPAATTYQAPVTQTANMSPALFQPLTPPGPYQVYGDDDDDDE